MEILKKSAEAGLVHGVSNQQEGIDTICNCDPCCCMWFTALFKLKRSSSLTPPVTGSAPGPRCAWAAASAQEMSDEGPAPGEAFRGDKQEGGGRSRPGDVHRLWRVRIQNARASP